MKREMSTPNIEKKDFISLDLSELLRPYSNQWVALTSDEKRVLAAGMSPVEVLTQAHNAGEVNPVLTHVARHHTPHVI